MADVFISYSDKSPKAAEEIADELDRAGISYWLARRHMKIGQSFPKEIQKAIKNCKVFLLILDKNSNQSEHVLNEINLAFRRKNNHEAIDFLVFKTDDCKVSIDIDYFLNRFQHMDGNPPNPQRVWNLTRRITELLGKQLIIKEQKPPKKWKLSVIFTLVVFLLTVVVSVTTVILNHIGWTFENGVLTISEKSKLEMGHTEWKFENGVLTISGKGPMQDYEPIYITEYSFIFNTPWWGLRSNIISIVIENGVTSIGNNAFISCENLTAVAIPNGVTSIGTYSFSGCGLETVAIPDSVTSIGEFAFAHCHSLIAVTIPDSVASIGECAFQSCISLTEITIPNSVTTIENWTFGGCNSLTEITIPNNVKRIEDSAFLGCDNLIEITIPESVTYIGNSAFWHCDNLKKVNVPANVEIVNGAFDDWTEVTRYW